MPIVTVLVFGSVKPNRLGFRLRKNYVKFSFRANLVVRGHRLGDGWSRVCCDQRIRPLPTDTSNKLKSCFYRTLLAVIKGWWKALWLICNIIVSAIVSTHTVGSESIQVNRVWVRTASWQDLPGESRESINWLSVSLTKNLLSQRSHLISWRLEMHHRIRKLILDAGPNRTTDPQNHGRWRIIKDLKEESTKGSTHLTCFFIRFFFHRNSDGKIVVLINIPQGEQDERS